MKYKMLFENIDNLLENIKSVVEVSGNQVVIRNDKLLNKVLDELVENVQFNEGSEIKKTCQKIIRQVAQVRGVYPSSIYSFYRAYAQGKFSNLTVPAINLRGMTYESARALIRAALRKKVGTFIVELAASEIEYTNQSPAEYVSVILAAAVWENFSGPLFIQADHFKIDLKQYREKPDLEIERIKNLISQSIEAGFFNIDIDMSALLDESESDPFFQQKENFVLTAYFTKFIRDIQPKGIDINIGGEVGEIGKKNTTSQDLHAFMKGYQEELSKFGKVDGISKIGIQNGVVHGGVILPDGSLGRVKLDLELLRELSSIARDKYGLAGAVQHGASTLPDEVFKKFPLFQAIEIHLATGFQNIIFDHPYFPSELRQKIYQWLKENKKDEWPEGLTEAQFIYKMRKKAWGPFKKEIASIDKKAKEKIAKSLEDKFSFFFGQLGVENSQKLAKKYS